MSAFRIDFPPELPISSRAGEIVDLIGQHPVLILAGETGSGKTTQIPKMCLAAGRGRAGLIACTQPRRVAALSVSRRVAEELGVEWGRQVGCKIRFDDRTSRDTVIKFMTDGMLLAEVQGDPMLRAYDTIILDEAHERSLNIDFLLGHLRTLRFRRPELKIIITSATIDTQAFSHAFDDAPIIEVSGRTFPVEVIHEPLDGLGDDSAEGDEPEARSEALHYIDGAVEAVERVVRESRTDGGGDILVFMPAERDIREARELIEGRRLPDCEVVPLFGRLSNADQQRVFAPSQRRKIIVATNIAETSLTIPGIRFVIDTGLARVSRYSPQARTRRLPIEPVSQSSADQRKGRAGRVAAGVCIRLYSEKDYEGRPRFTQPEIQRANLADVILRMKAFGLGDIERFPFINMPAAKSIRAGYALLEEIGALEKPGAGAAADTSVLTPLGRELARLPVDPTVGRMILQAREEKAVREVLVIAAGLSIQDPRERPLEAREKADAAHRRFAHPDSDFLTLLNIWDAFHDEVDRLSQSRLRRFCKDHFLSYTRMREWRDVHAQLLDVLEQRRDFRLTSVFDGLKPHEITPDKEAFGTPAYRAIHRSILAGLLGNIASRDDENGGYKGTHDRRVAIFPGSVLFRREEKPKKHTDANRAASVKAAAADKRGPRWLLAAEIMETSRLYARTCARLDPLWALELGAHVVRVSHSDPFWNVDNGRVLVKQRTRLYGLELESRAVSYGRIDPAHATEIFIREGLVNDTITWPFPFLEHNRAVRAEVESLLTRTRDASYLNLDEAFFRFYAARLGTSLKAEEEKAGQKTGGEADATSRNSGFQPAAFPHGVSSVQELVKLARARAGADPDFLKIVPADLRDPEELRVDAEAFPEALPLQNTALPLNYAYKPGQADDGVTLDVHIRDAAALTPAALDWAVPGHLPERIEHCLRALPKELRRGFVPLAETSKTLAAAAAARDRLTGRRETLSQSLAACIAEKHGVRVDPALWTENETARPLPDHLRVRIRVLDDDGREICASRDLAEIHALLATRGREASRSVAQEDPENWRRARLRWEKAGQSAWTFGDIPARVPVGDLAGVPVFAFPGLKPTPAGDVSLRLFKTPEAAQASSREGIARLLELHLRHKLAWLQKDLRQLRELGALTATLASMNQLQDDAMAMLQRWLCDPARLPERRHSCRCDEAQRASPLAGASYEFPEPGDASRRHSGRYRGQRPTACHAAAPSIPPPSDTLLSAADFTAAAAKAEDDLRGLVPRLLDLLREILTLRQALLVHPQPYPGLEKDLAALLPSGFLRTTPWPRLRHLPRYLKAMKLRADRWRQNAPKDAERARTLAPYVTAYARGDGLDADARETLRWLVEELRVSLFAQELGTDGPVSPVKLDRMLAAWRQGKAAAAGDGPAGAPVPGSPVPTTPSPAPSPSPAPKTSPIVAAPVVRPAEKKSPMKSFGALDTLFRR
ncbi:ATP-dependent helicase [Opitutaceae bacterium TAV5]|nr:ATP-dependent helicase [Opitutaceae bacterium TAV5]